MKTTLTLIVLFIFLSVNKSQAQDSITFKNYTYHVGDTITLNQPAKTDEFKSAMIGMTNPPSYLQASYAGSQLIIKKIRVDAKGKLQETVWLVCNVPGMGGLMKIRINLKAAHQLNELVLK